MKSLSWSGLLLTAFVAAAAVSGCAKEAAPVTQAPAANPSPSQPADAAAPASSEDSYRQQAEDAQRRAGQGKK